MELNFKGPESIFKEWEIFRVCLLAVIDSPIKSQGDASTDSKSRNFRRKLSDAFSAFQKTRSTLSKVHVEVIIAATLLPTSVNFGDAFSAFQKTRSTLSKVHVEVIITATLLPTSVNFGDAFSAF